MSDSLVPTVRGFVRLREMVGSIETLRATVDGLEREYDAQFKIVFDTIRELMAPAPTRAKRSIGFIQE